MSWRGPVFASLLAGGAAWVACADFSSNDAPADAGAEASVEAGPIGDGGTAGCARFADATFCVDFEKPDPLSAMVWTAPRTSTDAGTITVTTERSVSPSHAASFVMADGGPACNFLLLERSFSGAHQAIRARLSVSVEKAGWFFVVSSHPSSSIGYVLLVAMSEQFVAINVQQNGPDGGPYDRGTASIPFDTTPLGTFQDVTVEIDSAMHVAHLTVGSRTTDVTLPLEYTTKDARISLGPFCHNDDQQVIVDDVAVWVTP